MRTTTIESGSTVAHYRVITLLGAGGMGEVYKAHDNHLERTVALKILPPDLVKNDERVRRFIQEAKSASSLNHPHIVTIYEIGEARVSSTDGSDGEQSIQYIAMELIDGSTLRRKIHDGETDLRTLLGYLAQAAEGLAKAHAAGIVHRDLKPDNIMVTRDGFAKVLDFGLAKLSVKKSASEGLSQTTAVRDDTREGTLLGTVGYMSPEQVQGKAADHRSDIFSFGAILYEAATRRRPFEADSDVDVMHKILHDKPVPVDEINPVAPAELRRMIRRCLAKDPDKRFQSMKDLALELVELVDEFEQLSLASTTRSSGSVSGELATPRRSKALWIGGALLALLTLAGIVIGGIALGVFPWLLSGESPVSFASMRIEPLTSSGNTGDAAVSPDGKYVAHVIRDDAGRFSIWMRQVATGTDVQLVAPVPTTLAGLAYSPDGAYLYYTNADSIDGPRYSTLYQLPALGGAARKVLFDIDTPVAFSPDGKQIAFGRGVPQSSQNLLMVANADGTSERKLATFDRFDNPGRPSWSPDGKKIALGVIAVVPRWHANLVEIDVATGGRKTIGTGQWFEIGAVQWLPGGDVIAMTAFDMQSGRSQVWLQPYPAGPAVRVTNDANDYYRLSMTADAKVMVAIQEQSNGDLFLSDVSDASGGSQLARLPNQRPGTVAVSDAGPVVYGFLSGSVADIAMVDAPGAVPRVLTNTHLSFDPAITADGRTIFFQSEHVGGAPHIYAIDADGSNLRQITRGAAEFDPSVSDDGRTLVYGTQGNGLWTMALPAGTPRRISAARSGAGAVSPDGKLVAFAEWVGEARASTRLKVLPLAGGPPLIDIPWASGLTLRYHPSGKGVTFRRLVDGAHNVWLQPFTGAAPTQLTQFRKSFISSYDWTRDGKLVLSRGQPRSDMVLIRDFRR